MGFLFQESLDIGQKKWPGGSGKSDEQGMGFSVSLKGKNWDPCMGDINYPKE